MIQRVDLLIEYDGGIGYQDTVTFSNFIDHANIYNDHEIFILGISKYEPNKYYKNYYSNSYGIADGYDDEFDEITYSYEENENGLIGKVTETEDDGDVYEILYNYTFK